MTAVPGLIDNTTKHNRITHKTSVCARDSVRTDQKSIEAYFFFFLDEKLYGRLFTTSPSIWENPHLIIQRSPLGNRISRREQLQIGAVWEC